MSEKGLADCLNYRQRIRAKIKDLEIEVERCDTQLKRQLTEMHADELTAAGFVVSWKDVTTTKLDAKRFRDECPELAEAYSETTTAKRYSVRVAS